MVDQVKLMEILTDIQSRLNSTPALAQGAIPATMEEVDRFLAFLDEKHAGVLHAIEQTGKLEDDTVEHLRAAIEEFKSQR